MKKYRSSSGSILSVTLAILVIVGILMSAITMAIAFDAQFQLKKAQQQFTYIEMETTAYQLLNTLVENESLDDPEFDYGDFMVSGYDNTTSDSNNIITFYVTHSSVSFSLKVSVEFEQDFKYTIKAWGKYYD